MEIIRHLARWLSGGATQYHTLTHCMQFDTFWISLTVTLDFLVALGYVLIAYHWNRNERVLPPSPARTALRTMRNIFVFCGICGYLFIPVKLVWPAWRLYDMLMVVLVFYTWRYALNAKNMRVIYTAIGRSNQLAEDLAKSREESKQKTFYLNAISHDLRTPLNGLMLQANLAEIHLTSNDLDAAQQAIEEIKASTRLTADLLDGLLEFARLEVADDRTAAMDFDLGDLLRDILNSQAAAAAKKSLELACDSLSSVKMHSDRLRLERILNNLVGNAIKFTERGSVRVVVESDRQKVRICVIDTGIGIAPAHQGRLFEEFFQVKNDERDRQKGFGLGLAICRRLVQQLGGEIQLQSQVGVGSRFTVIVPRVMAAAQSEVVSNTREFEPAGLVEQPVGAAGGR
jgi:signal transduction histidine kinase